MAPSLRKTIGSRGLNAKKPVLLPLRQILTILMVALVVVYVYVAQTLFRKSSSPVNEPDTAEHQQRLAAVQQFVETHLIKDAAIGATAASPKLYQDWKSLAVDLAALTPAVVLQILNDHDPFGVRGFEKALLDAESSRGAFLSQGELQSLFECPTHSRITLPDKRHHETEELFHTDNAYLFFQHLRKAGGTNFCALAEANLERSQVPSYFCMPDMDWSEAGGGGTTRTKQQQQCAGCLHSYPTAEIEQRMKRAGHKILGNEWDPFEANRFFQLTAVFATSFRKPLDRALSQFRFECIEDRGCTIKTIEEWWKARCNDLTNVYVWTFSNRGIRKASIGSSPELIQRRQEALGEALDVVAKFHLVLVMEWLAYAAPQVQQVLKFYDTTALTKRVRPHIAQAKRDDGQERNSLGAAGIAKASWDPREYLSKEQHKIMSEDLALDEILTDAARRMFLERVVCDDMRPATTA